jgi:hypothetical protein
LLLLLRGPRSLLQAPRWRLLRLLLLEALRGLLLLLGRRLHRSGVLTRLPLQVALRLLLQVTLQHGIRLLVLRGPGRRPLLLLRLWWWLCGCRGCLRCDEGSVHRVLIVRGDGRVHRRGDGIVVVRGEGIFVEAYPRRCDCQGGRNGGGDPVHPARRGPPFLSLSRGVALLLLGLVLRDRGRQGEATPGDAGAILADAEIMGLA